MSKQVHYSMDKIDKIKARFNLIFGERSNGKSYQLKHKKGVEYYLKTGRRFILLRRLREEITSEKIELYFSDVDVSKLTNKKYNIITTYRKAIYFANYDNETGKIQRGEKIGYVAALSTEQNFAGASYLDVDNIIFEEFMSRSNYLKSTLGGSECNALMNFYATVDRKRLTTRLWLVGNTITKVCPYLQEWGLQKIIENMKQGDIKIKTLKDELNNDNIDIAIEYCKSTNKSSGIIGTNARMINKGEWESHPQPHLEYSYKKYNILFRCGFYYKGFAFLGELLSYNNDIVWFIKPYKRKLKDNIIIFSDVIKSSRYWNRDIYNVNIKNDKLLKIFSTFRESKIFYSDDMCGTDFKQCIDFVIKR